MSTKRRLKRKIKIPLKFGDTVYDLMGRKNKYENSEKSDERGEIRGNVGDVCNGGNGDSGVDGSKELDVMEMAWTVNGISAIASSLGKPLIIDKTTTRMCTESTGRVGYARVLVEENMEELRKSSNKFSVLKNLDGTELSEEHRPKVGEKVVAGYVDEEDVCEVESGMSKNVSKNALNGRISDEEVKNALFNICDNKAPGPAGNTLKFYKKSWSIVGKDVCSVVKEFLAKEKMLGEVNATLIALVPKLNTPIKVFDYRPIAYCNVLYKIISKILTNRIKTAMCKIVSPSQSALIPGRQIIYNILLTRELLRRYTWKNGPKRVAMKIDIHKVYDTVNWDFLECILKEFEFP
ncbi:RNA-directed DNA polymerase, eukaryota, reverse transcriptase zinc-binding domain protein [Tanacetum coccineum]